MRKYRFVYRTACQGKVKHRSYADAEAYLRKKQRIKRHRSGDEELGGRIQVYRCKNPLPYVHWHVGKSNDGKVGRNKPYKRRGRYTKEDV